MNSPRINRVLQVLSLVAFASKPTQLKDIGLKLGLHPSMVSRIVADLIAGGLLAKVAYRSVVGTPELALLGKKAGENHPLSRIGREILHKPMEEMALSCEFVTVVRGGLFHFYKVYRGTPAQKFLWRSDAAAVIFAARGDEWEQVMEELIHAAPEEEILNAFAFFRERFLAAQESRSLINHHSGRYWQLSLPFQCGPTHCALSVAGTAGTDMDKVFYTCSRLTAAIRSRCKELSDRDA